MSSTGPKPQWLQISIQTPSQLIEATSDLIGVLSGSGVEETPDTGGGSCISGYFKLDENLELSEQVAEISQTVRSRLEALFTLYEMQPEEIETSLIDDQDWSTSWKQFFTPFEIIPDLVIKPSWEKYEALPEQKIIEMDPGMAFGTGQHASTKMALELIAEAMSPQVKNVLDVGTGTGILAMASALFGAGKIIAIDNDNDAVTAASENVQHNNLQEIITVSDTLLTDIEGSYDLICANIIHDVLYEMAEDIAARCAQNGAVVVAGILSGSQEKSITSRYAQYQLFQVDARYEDEWVALLFRNKF